MSASVLVVAVLVVAVGAWLVLRAKGEGEATGGGGATEAPSSFRCTLCGVTSRTFLAAHEHASAEHDLAGHKIDEAIEELRASAGKAAE